MAIRKKLIGVVVLCGLLLAFAGPVSADCILQYSFLWDTSCDPENWCWFFWGQLEYTYFNSYDCDGDGEEDFHSLDTVQGNCCSV